jgi:uroporphyrinogen-III synthase
MTKKKKVKSASKSSKPVQVKRKKTPAKPASKPLVKSTRSNKKSITLKPEGKKAVVTTAASHEHKISHVTELPKPKVIKRKAVVVPPPAPVQISNWPKAKVKHILVSQPRPADSDKNPYFELARKHNLNITFRQFIKVEGLNAMEFRAQRVEILSHSAVILTSKLAIDHFFRICQELRLTVPETMKYYCINEQTAYYLQKYIQYRKRKISFGTGSLQNLLDLIRKNKNEYFLLPCSDAQNEQIAEYMQQMLLRYSKSVFYRTVPADLKDIKNIQQFDVLVFFTPTGIRSLKQNFPQFKQQNTRIAAFGHSTGHAVSAMGYRLDIFAPNPKNPSMTAELEAYIKICNKR